MNSYNYGTSTAANYDDYSTQDRKILTWNGENRESFIDGFTKEELEEMNDYLVHHQFFPLDCEYDEDDRAGSIVCDYVRRWLYEQIELGIISGTRKLFEVVMALN